MMHRESNSEGLELFFTTFVDEDLNDDINLLTWIQSLKKLAFDKDMTEKEMIQIFYFIDCDRTGYIDCVDFVNFCLKNHAKGSQQDHNEKYISKLHKILLKNIESHPFVIG